MWYVMASSGCEADTVPIWRRPSSHTGSAKFRRGSRRGGTRGSGHMAMTYSGPTPRRRRRLLVEWLLPCGIERLYMAWLKVEQR